MLSISLVRPILEYAAPWITPVKQPIIYPNLGDNSSEIQQIGWQLEKNNNNHMINEEQANG